MDFIVCTLRNFNMIDYSSPVNLCFTEKISFSILYKEKEVVSVVNSYYYRENFGLIECDRIQSNFISMVISKMNILNTEKRVLIVNNHYIYNQMFSNALWFIKDNAVTPYHSTISSDYVIFPESLLRNVYYSNSEGNFDCTQFTRNELEESLIWFEKLDKYSIKHLSDILSYSKELTNMNYYIPNDLSSFQRALVYLDTARKIDFLPSKIATYISILEILFAVKGENTHKVAERAALFIGIDGEEKMRIFEEVKVAYDIRSKYVHGSKISSGKYDNIQVISKNTDAIIRRVFRKMLIENIELDYKNNSYTQVNQWFEELVIKRGV